MIEDTLRNRKRLMDYDISGVTLSGFSAAGVQIAGCNLSGITLERVSLEKAVFQLVYCDSASVAGCDFSGGTFQHSVFAGSELRDCNFSGCDLLLCNFMGVRCAGVTFDHSNLYASRFISGSFERVGMRDCNLTRARFDKDASGIDFRSSNTNEADFVGGEP